MVVFVICAYRHSTALRPRVQPIGANDNGLLGVLQYCNWIKRVKRNYLEATNPILLYHVIPAGIVPRDDCIFRCNGKYKALQYTVTDRGRARLRGTVGQLFNRSGLVRVRSHVNTRHFLIFIFVLPEINHLSPRTRTRLLGRFDVSTNKWSNLLCLYWA